MRTCEGIDWKELGERIKHLRHPRTILGYLKALGYEKDSGFLSRVENGIWKPSLRLLHKIANEGDVEIHWLVYGEEY